MIRDLSTTAHELLKEESDASTSNGDVRQVDRIKRREAMTVSAPPPYVFKQSRFRQPARPTFQRTGLKI